MNTADRGARARPARKKGARRGRAFSAVSSGEDREARDAASLAQLGRGRGIEDVERQAARPIEVVGRAARFTRKFAVPTAVAPVWKCR
jgi:hypothetical protein